MPFLGLFGIRPFTPRNASHEILPIVGGIGVCRFWKIGDTEKDTSGKIGDTGIRKNDTAQFWFIKRLCFSFVAFLLNEIFKSVSFFVSFLVKIDIVILEEDHGII